MFKTYFDQTQVVLLATAGMALLFSLGCWFNKKQRAALFFLVLFAFFLFSFAALLDPFLNLWDERFHALVAKNMLNHPLMPTLYDDPVLDISYDRWDRYQIWLHKQPLFMWQIMLSFKLFGISEYTLRLPMVIMMTAMVFFFWRIGQRLVNSAVGYYGAILFTTTLYITELVSGRKELEHNDIAFLFYVSASIWAWIEYLYSEKKRWILLVGIFTGGAILCKWLVGLIIYGGWGIHKLLHRETHIKKYIDLISALLITALIVLPWQILTYLWYPAEAAAAMAYNVKHFSVALEGHGGDAWYHFKQFPQIYGTLAPYILIPGIFLFIKKASKRKLAYAMLAMPLAVYLFFTLAETKMPSFTVMIALPVILILACFVEELFTQIGLLIKNKFLMPIISMLLIAVIIGLRYDIEKIQEDHTMWKADNIYTSRLTHNKIVFERMRLRENEVLFNVKGRHYIEAMFYTGHAAYWFIPSEKQYEELKMKGRPIAVIAPINNELPSYLTEDPDVQIIKETIEGWD